MVENVQAKAALYDRQASEQLIQQLIDNRVPQLISYYRRVHGESDAVDLALNVIFEVRKTLERFDGSSLDHHLWSIAVSQRDGCTSTGRDSMTPAYLTADSSETQANKRSVKALQSTLLSDVLHHLSQQRGDDAFDGHARGSVFTEFKPGSRTRGPGAGQTFKQEVDE